ncbi:MAG: acetyl-CoA carboxylase biotin carboxyl carrier protein [Spirochaetia bacterium]|jgi:acetyl-CoA carboxylase biotin carboxyl carrier protein|nr:acetyl-CoA carboxylase biotin carboxyl carrier protein [Spirochaetia bacterium]
MEHIDIKTIKDITALFNSSSMTELELEVEGCRLHMKKNSSGPAQSSVPVIKEFSEGDCKESGTETYKTITAPLVGTFYSAPSPDALPFAPVGTTITKGTTLCIIEALKMMNEMPADEDCKIMEVLAQEGSLVEFGQPLFKVKPL